MINLLPPSAKQNLIKEYWFRIGTVWLFILTLVLLIITTLLIPTYVAITDKVAVYAPDAEAALVEVDDYKLSSATLIEANKKAQLILSSRNVPSYTALIKKFEALTNDGISITQLAFAADGSNLKPITLSGMATTRESLARFREALLNEPDIETVFLPISNLAQDKDITFLITVTMKQPE